MNDTAWQRPNGLRDEQAVESFKEHLTELHRQEVIDDDVYEALHDEAPRQYEAKGPARVLEVMEQELYTMHPELDPNPKPAPNSKTKGSTRGDSIGSGGGDSLLSTVMHDTVERHGSLLKALDNEVGDGGSKGAIVGGEIGGCRFYSS